MQTAQPQQLVVNDHHWWDGFWNHAKGTTVTGADEPETWYDLVWQVTFEYWFELFERLCPGKRMLECGCGSARVSQYMAQRGYHCTLLDRSEQGLSLAKRNFEERSLKGEFVLGDIKSLGFREGEFDVVYSGGVLEFLGDLQRPAQEMVRVLKPGGLLAANIVPPKFSIQSIADIERTAAYALRNLAGGRFKEAFRWVRHIPREYHVHPWSLHDYLSAYEAAGLISTKGFVTTPFPALALPRMGQKLYARMMKALLPQWRRFNNSESRWSHWWGIGYAIHGIKERAGT